MDGAVTAWYNGVAIPSSGSSFQWNWQGNLSLGGSSRGEYVEFGELYGIGRADYIGMIFIVRTTDADILADRLSRCAQSSNLQRTNMLMVQRMS